MEEGAIIHVDYDLFSVDTGDLIETTRETVAKEHEMHQEGRTYSPMVCVVGTGNLIQGFEAALREAKVGKEVDVEISPEDAYGEKDNSLVETISIDKLKRSVQDPNSIYLGAPVTLNGRQGYLSYLAAGRARIDYNHPMAGRALRYVFTVVKEVKGKDDKVLGLLESNTGHDGFEVSFSGDDLSIILPQAMLFDTNAAMLKFRLVTMIREALDCGKISFVEVHEPRIIPELNSQEANEDLTKLSVAELKERLKAKGLPVGGKKAELIARLQDVEEE